MKKENIPECQTVSGNDVYCHSSDRGAFFSQESGNEHQPERKK